tara:strand:+ start:933 stop:1292 length:360 start_codon:yes stop_codon:yes gene_type:complete
MEKEKTEEKVEKQQEESSLSWTKEEQENCKKEYGCEIVIQRGSMGDVSTKKAPTDAYIITYNVDEEVLYDLTRGTKINIFDMYWDKFKEGLKTINYGKGTVKPNLWGYTAPKPNKKRKG